MDQRGSKKSTAKWASQVVNAVLAGEIEPALVEPMEELLQWLANAQTPEVKAISAEFRKRNVDGEEAQQLALALLDRALFDTSGICDPSRILGILRGASRDVIQTRYHRLMQIYHPDRNQGNPEWSNCRTERLNWAYSELKKDAHERSTPVRAGNPGSSMEPGISTATYDTDFHDMHFHKGADLRNYLGGAARFQIRFLIGLILMAIGLLGYLYFYNA